MKLFWGYVRSRKAGVASFLITVALFATVFALYRVPRPVTGYAALLSLFFCVLVGAADFVAFARRYARIRALMREATLSETPLPIPQTALEEAYQDVIRAVQAEKAAAASEQARRYAELTEYYAVWTHQIKTPISAMRLMLQSGDAAPGELADELRQIEQYVEMALGYARLTGGSGDYLIRRVPLDGIVRQAVRGCASQFIRRRIRLLYEPVTITVLTDEKWLLFVLGQILSNALKYTPSGGSVTISLSGPETLSIRDTGIGIAPEDLPRIFERGYTGENGRTDKSATGIGLWLSQRILRNLGHTISVSSRPGAGTEIRLGLQAGELQVE